MSDFTDLMEQLGYDPSDPEALDRFINSLGDEPDEIYSPDGNIDLDDVVSLTQCDDPDECADCEGECELDCDL